MPREFIHSQPAGALLSSNHQQQVVFAPVYTENTVMDELLLMGGDTLDRFDEHGVKIDYQYN